ncbi:MAG: hypothetical protein VYE22_36990 [Myxococcota bacterium]|nr:hypothetical protein [Myxococcota bacterium]
MPIRLALALALGLLGCDGGEGVADGGGSDARVAARDGGDDPRDARAPTPDAAPGEDASTEADAGSGGEGWLRDRYPGDVGIADDPAVLFHDDFESGWGRWDRPTADTRYLHLESGPEAHAGERYLRSTVTTADLAEDMYISSSTRVQHAPADEVWWRFHARFPNVAPNPHHWVRFSAGDETWGSSGRANTVPPGDRGFWFDFDANIDDVFNFYAYWYRMRSGRCNDGSTTPGCAGDQGTTYHYGNVFRPPGQDPFPRDRWFCIEIHAKANTVGAQDGELSFWIDDAPVGDFRPGHPDGTWLRDQFHTGGCEFSACTPPEPFEGFDFRSSEDVQFRELFLDAYYERNSSARRRMNMEARGLTVSDEQTILYDDVVVATERIGCRR